MFLYTEESDAQNTPCLLKESDDWRIVQWWEAEQKSLKMVGVVEVAKF